VAGLRDHAEKILLAIAKDMETAQTEAQRDLKSRGLAAPMPGPETCAAAHGALRQLVGFNLEQLAAEYRAFRATVLRLWRAESGSMDESAVEQITRFNEGVDQVLAESISSYAAHVASSRDLFLAVLGHDLRNPLGSVSGCFELLANENLAAQPRTRALEIGRRSLLTIETLITDLLEYTRTRLGRGMEVEPKRGDIGVMCSQAFDEITAAYPKRTVNFSIEGDLTCVFDVERMHQALTNLLGNAVQHGEPTCPVELSVREDSGEVIVWVRIWGVPIPPDMLQVIFDPLVQIPAIESEPHERPATSLGLGLFIAREIVMAHGGHIGVTSSTEDGTTFTVRLPKAGSPLERG
jgi:signal transduction histidine kinase